MRFTWFLPSYGIQEWHLKSHEVWSHTTCTLVYEARGLSVAIWTYPENNPTLSKRERACPICHDCANIRTLMELAE